MALQTVTGGGTFSRLNVSQLNSNFSALANPDMWVRPQNTNPTAAPDGTYEKPYASMTAVAPYLQPGMVVGVLGVLRDEFVAPLGLNDITIRGMGNKPRQATTSGVANGGGATWLSPSAGATSTTTPLCNLRAQAWTLENLFMNNSATNAPAVLLTVTGGGDPPTEPDASHATIDGCWITGAKYGISSTGLPNFVTVKNNVLFGFGDSGDTAIAYAVGSGSKTLYGWQINNNEFWGNSRHIQAGFSGASIHDNHLTYINGGVTTAIFYDATGGQDNAVFDNTFDVNSGNAGIAAMFVLGTNDRFSGNRLSTAVATTQFSWGDPA